MANKEHLKILRNAGVEAWREFVQGQKYMFRAQLDGADLSTIDLQWMALHGANLHGANFRRADLQRANMINANLWDAGPQRALLNGTIFRYPI